MKEVFDTPYGKVEIYSEKLKKYGYDPLPLFREPAEIPRGYPKLPEDHPLVLTTGSRINVFHHSEFCNISVLRGLIQEPFFEINPHTAEGLNIANNDMAIVESTRGRIKINTRVTGDIIPGVVNMTHGWTEASPNELTNDVSGDPLTGFPEYRSLLCRVERAKESP